MKLLTFHTQREKWLWLAAFIDAEGGFEIKKRLSETCALGFQWIFALVVSNNNKDVIDFIHYTFGGYKDKYKNKKIEKEAIHFRVEIKSQKLLIPLIKQILPYLIVKDRDARILYKAMLSQDNMVREKCYWELREKRSPGKGRKRIHPELYDGSLFNKKS